ncbi:MAG TPA: hypothetical protein VIV35_09650 [Chitinophagaceae bacterium]
MKLPQQYAVRKYPLYELSGLVIILILLIIILSKRYIHFDWILDSLWIISGSTLVFLEWTKEKPPAAIPVWLTAPTTQLLFCLYLFLYHFFAFLLTLSFGGFVLVLYLGAAILYALALWLRAKEAGINIAIFQWKTLLRYPAWPFSIAVTLCLLGLFLPMLRVSRLSGGLGYNFGYDYYNGWGYNLGYTLRSSLVTIKGTQARWGELIGLLLSFLLVFHIVRTAGNISYPKLDMFNKIAAGLLIAWWLFAIKGFESLAKFGNILFILGTALFVFAIFFPKKLGELVKERGLIE